MAHWGAVVPRKKMICALIPCVVLTVCPLALLCPFKGGSMLVTLTYTVTPHRDSVDRTRDHVTYQKLVTR